MVCILSAIMFPIFAHAQFSRMVHMPHGQHSLSLFSYKGFVDAGYIAGVGHYQANKFEVTTSHGLSSGNLFLGIGAGLDVLKTDNNDGSKRRDVNMDLSDNAYMLPLFFDFRYNGTGDISLFLDLKTGISMLLDDGYITVNDGIFNNDVSFYLSCSLGVRFAIGAKSALNVGVIYSLISQNYSSYDDYYHHNNRYNGISLHGIGVTLGLEW